MGGWLGKTKINNHLSPVKLELGLSLAISSLTINFIVIDIYNTHDNFFLKLRTFAFLSSYSDVECF